MEYWITPKHHITYEISDGSKLELGTGSNFYEGPKLGIEISGLSPSLYVKVKHIFG